MIQKSLMNMGDFFLCRRFDMEKALPATVLSA